MMKMNREKKTERQNNLKELFNNWGIEHFAPFETYQLNNPNWPSDSVYPPPTRIHKNIEDTIKLADKIREKWASPVRCVSGFRPYLYNELINGSESSMHMDYHALDLQPINSAYQKFREHVEQIVKQEREKGSIIGFGKYDTFIHIDTGHYSYNRNWDMT